MLRLLALICCVFVASVAQMNEGGGNVGNSGDFQGVSKQGEGEGIEGPLDGNVALQDVRNPGEEAGGAVESNRAVGDRHDRVRNQQAPADGILNTNNETVAIEENQANKSGPQSGKTNANEGKIPTDKSKNVKSGNQTAVIPDSTLNRQMTPQGEEAVRVAGVDGPDGINDGIFEYNVNRGKTASKKTSNAGAGNPSPIIPGSDINERGVARTNNKHVEGNDGPLGGADIDSPLRRQVGPKSIQYGEAADAHFGGSDSERKVIKRKPKKKTKAIGGASQ